MNFDLDVSIPMLTVFLQGILSFLSPCVLPIIPLYMGYLSGGTISVNEDGTKNFSQKKVIINTLFFIIGVSFAFFLLGLGVSAVGKFFTEYQMIFSRVGGILIVILGLMQLGVLDKLFKGKEYRLPVKLNVLKMNPITALIMGFIFSFAWTPCVGPALSTVLIMISSAKTTSTGIFLMGVYTLGFTIPFLLVGIFTTKCLEFFKNNRSIIAHTIKIGGVLMILMGIMMFTGIMNNITGYLSTFDGFTQKTQSTQKDDDTKDENTKDENTKDDDTKDESINDTEDSTKEQEIEEVVPAIDFELLDQFGNTHKLSDYKGKVVFLNFWATWCPPCKAEMPDIQKLYENYGFNEDEVIILGVASPKSDENQYTQEKDEEHVISFLEENNYTYPTVLDNSGMLQMEYGISAYPTTYMIDVDGNIFGYLPGMMTYDIMESIIQQTIDG